MTLDHRFITSKKAFELLYKKLSSTTFPVKKKYTGGRWTLDQREFGIMERTGGKSDNENGSGGFYVINIIVSTAVVETRTYLPRRPYSTAVDL